MHEEEAVAFNQFVLVPRGSDAECISESQVMGDPNAVIGREYMFVLEAVSSVTDAKAYMKGKKMAIALLYNEVTADENDWEDATNKMTRFTIFPIQTQFPQEQVMQLTLGEVKKRDNMLEPFHGSLTEENYQLVDYEERHYRQL